jgi:SAM-dependent methyltransferase
MNEHKGRDLPVASFGCPCGSVKEVDTIKYLRDEMTSLSYSQCGNCGLWQMIPQPTDRELAQAYSPAYYGTTRSKFIAPIAALIKVAQRARAHFVFRHIGKEKPEILDVGCGNAGFLLAASKLGAVCEGTEFSSESAARASIDTGISIHAANLGEIRKLGRRYDAISMWHVIEHLRDPEGDVAHIAALLKPGGRLFVAAPNHASWQARFFKERWFHLDPPRHLWGFCPSSLRSMLGRHGLEQLCESTASLEHNPFGIVQSVLNSCGFPHNRAYETLKGTPYSLTTKLTDLVCVAGLTLPSIMTATLESAFGCGGVFCLVARKANNVQG